MSAPVELLILKAGADYLRCSDGGVSRCGLDKASVFPLSALDDVQERRERLRAAEVPDAEIYRLTIREELLAAAEPRP